jgi:hypothetical protein
MQKQMQKQMEKQKQTLMCCSRASIPLHDIFLGDMAGINLP